MTEGLNTVIIFQMFSLQGAIHVFSYAYDEIRTSDPRGSHLVTYCSAASPEVVATRTKSGKPLTYHKSIAP